MTGNVFLVGMMAVGKSTVGRIAATELHLAFYDTDKVIEERTGADISWIFDREGEDGFRDREEHVVAELARRERVLLATGGGAVLRERNRRRLRAHGTVVYLRSPPDVIAERVRGDRQRPLRQQRPLLQVDDVRERIDALCREREPLYCEAAHVVVEAGRRPVRVVAEAVVDALAADRA